ncbi:MAG: ligand-binding protein SH3 [Desulfobacteraceae bacterium]|nr:ligand-binding protein SH3 [Desulfobacteraceae bacterium]
MKICLIFAFASLFYLPVWAQEPVTDSSRDMEEFLSGFDDETGQKDSLDDVLDGFDDSGTPAETSEDSGLEELLDGFEDSVEMTEKKPARYEKPSLWDISGYFKVSSACNFAHEAPKSEETDFRGLSRLRGEMDIKLDIDLPGKWKARIGANARHDLAYRINGPDNYTDEVLDDSESEAEFREVFLRGSLTSDLDIKVGRQILPWGVSESIRIVDVLNPMDRREFGMTDIEDIRLPVTMTRLDYYAGAWEITGVAVHEIRFNKEPPYGSDFYPGGAPFPSEEPGTSLENTELALGATGRFSGWDMSFHAARFFDDNAHMESNGLGRAILRHSRVFMFGSTILIARGNWLFKTEGAYFHGFEFFNIPNEKKSRFDLLAGIEYSGFTETTVTLEAVSRHLSDYNDRMGKAHDYAEDNDFMSALRIASDFKNNTLHLILLAAFQGPTGQDGSLQRVSLEYDWKDNLSLTMGGILYHIGDDIFFEKTKDNDRVFFDMKYSF